MLLQPPEPSTTAAAAAAETTSSRVLHREDKSHDTAALEAADGQELTALSSSEISPLQPFELEDSAKDSFRCEQVSQVAERLKDRGNTLFKLGDTDAAAEMFTRVLRTLEQTPVAGERQRWAGLVLSCGLSTENRLDSLLCVASSPNACLPITTISRAFSLLPSAL